MTTRHWSADFEVKCPSCKKKFSAMNAMVAQIINCSGCGAGLVVVEEEMMRHIAVVRLP